jgi:hypothetical protein
MRKVREVLRLRHALGLSYREISEALERLTLARSRPFTLPRIKPAAVSRHALGITYHRADL